MSTTMTLGVENLPAPEIKLIRTILQLSTDLGGRWTVSEDGPCDVLLVDDEAGAATVPMTGARIVSVRRRHDDQQPGVLYRPIRAEELISLLNGQAGDVPATHRRPDGASADPVAFASDRRGVLTRWPEWEVLQVNRAFVPLATFLTRSAHSVDSLAAISGQSLADCEALMRELARRGLLRWESVSSAQSQAVQAIARAAAPRAPEPGSPAAESVRERRGLLGALRRRLGL